MPLQGSQSSLVLASHLTLEIPGVCLANAGITGGHQVCLTFGWVLGICTPVHVCVASTLPTEPSPQLRCCDGYSRTLYSHLTSEQIRWEAATGPHFPQVPSLLSSDCRNISDPISTIGAAEMFTVHLLSPSCFLLSGQPLICTPSELTFSRVYINGNILPVLF